MDKCENCSADLIPDNNLIHLMPDGKFGCDECAGQCAKCGARRYNKDGRYIDDGSNDWWCVPCITKKYNLPT